MGALKNHGIALEIYNSAQLLLSSGRVASATALVSILLEMLNIDEKQAVLLRESVTAGTVPPRESIEGALSLVEKALGIRTSKLGYFIGGLLGLGTAGLIIALLLEGLTGAIIASFSTSLLLAGIDLTLHSVKQSHD